MKIFNTSETFLVLRTLSRFFSKKSSCSSLASRSRRGLFTDPWPEAPPEAPPEALAEAAAAAAVKRPTTSAPLRPRSAI